MQFSNEDNARKYDDHTVVDIQDAIHAFYRDEEVRFSADTLLLAPVCNILAAGGRLFYLIHLPDQGGWVLRRKRPTGEFMGGDCRPRVERDVGHRPDAGVIAPLLRACSNLSCRTHPQP